MPRALVYLLPILYAVTGGFLWYEYGTQVTGIALWVCLQLVIMLIYRWLLGDRDYGLMLKFHLWSTAIGMVILFYVLFPWRTQTNTSQLILELVLMGLGTFFCAVGLFSLLYMTVRKLIYNLRQPK